MTLVFSCPQPITLFAKERCKFTAPAFQDAAVLSVAAAMQAGTSVGRNPSFEWCAFTLMSACSRQRGVLCDKGRQASRSTALPAGDSSVRRYQWQSPVAPSSVPGMTKTHRRGAASCLQAGPGHPLLSGPARQDGHQAERHPSRQPEHRRLGAGD